jgi:hypothetical protein
MFDSFTCLEVIINQTGVLFFGTPGTTYKYLAFGQVRHVYLLKLALRESLYTSDVKYCSHQHAAYHSHKFVVFVFGISVFCHKLGAKHFLLNTAEQIGAFIEL